MLASSLESRARSLSKETLSSYTSRGDMFSLYMYSDKFNEHSLRILGILLIFKSGSLPRTSAVDPDPD
jgi:hypothetical protein